jgi:hypothetical protein
MPSTSSPDRSTGLPFSSEEAIGWIRQRILRWILKVVRIQELFNV